MVKKKRGEKDETRSKEDVVLLEVLEEVGEGSEGREAIVGAEDAEVLETRLVDRLFEDGQAEGQLKTRSARGRLELLFQNGLIFLQHRGVGRENSKEGVLEGVDGPHVVVLSDRLSLEDLLDVALLVELSLSGVQQSESDQKGIDRLADDGDVLEVVFLEDLELLLEKRRREELLVLRKLHDHFFVCERESLLLCLLVDLDVDDRQGQELDKVVRLVVRWELSIVEEETLRRVALSTSSVDLFSPSQTSPPTVDQSNTLISYFQKEKK